MSLMTARRNAFAEMVTATAKLLPDWQTYVHRGGDPEAHFSDEIGRDVEVRMGPGGTTTVTNWLPDGTQQSQELADSSPETLVAAIGRAAQEYDAADPAREFLARAVTALPLRHRVTWRDRTAYVRWLHPGNGHGELSIGRGAVGQNVRALVSLYHRSLLMETAIPIVVAATEGHPRGEAEGAGRAAQPLIDAAPALWLSETLLNEETDAVERADLTVDDVHVSVTSASAGRPVEVNVSITTWVGLDRIVDVLAATPRP
ncbi:hypothetical protein [Streptomyces sp. NPDC001536]|uniref:hypothetical protein n=1 Tax=Streptomyces sp. NPDC001536 TaxID=3364583 RepID=UPI00369421C3